MSEATAASAIRDLASAHRVLLSQRELQFKFSAPLVHPPSFWMQLLAQFGRWLAPIAPYVTWAAVIAGALIILVFVVRELMHGKRPMLHWRPNVMGQESGEWRPSPRKARALLEEADGLAAQGLYEQAAHLILLRSIEDIQARRPNAVRPSLTSRDIADLTGLPPAARALFGGIAQAVERSLFGGLRLDEEGFLVCRDAYERFAAGASWS